MKYYLYNPKSNNGISVNVPGAALIDATTLDYPAYFAGLDPEDEVVLIGGDGTINYFINHVDVSKLKNNVYILANGTGNDFLHDLGEEESKEVLLNPYIQNLPTVWVNGKSYKFINNMGFGIDGYCCEEADRIKAKKPNKKINYAGIAIKGMLYAFKPRKAVVEVDGVKHEFDHVWMAPTMKGRFYGGGLMAAPGQNRNGDQLTLVITTCKSKFKVLKIFPSYFKGEHIKYDKIVKILTGKKIKVKYSKPCAAMIDGETVLDVKEYRAEQP
ncbi:MAG: diacylglycerol kinase family protein [Ruminococcus sp.]|nr:diacylglycerol kinase family protein [Ruminococcus sp.]